MPSQSSAPAKAFDKAIAGLKQEDASEALNLAALLVSLGNALDDGTMMLCGFDTAATCGPFMQLKTLTIVDASLGQLIKDSAKELVAGLTALRAALVTDGDPNPSDVLTALGHIARIGLKLSQRLQQASQMSPMGGGRGEE